MSTTQENSSRITTDQATLYELRNILTEVSSLIEQVKYNPRLIRKCQTLMSYVTALDLPDDVKLHEVGTQSTQVAALYNFTRRTGGSVDIFKHMVAYGRGKTKLNQQISDIVSFYKTRASYAATPDLLKEQQIMMNKLRGQPLLPALKEMKQVVERQSAKAIRAGKKVYNTAYNLVKRGKWTSDDEADLLKEMNNYYKDQRTCTENTAFAVGIIKASFEIEDESINGPGLKTPPELRPTEQKNEICGTLFHIIEHQVEHSENARKASPFLARIYGKQSDECGQFREFCLKDEADRVQALKDLRAEISDRDFKQWLMTNHGLSAKEADQFMQEADNMIANQILNPYSAENKALDESINKSIQQAQTAIDNLEISTLTTGTLTGGSADFSITAGLLNDSNTTINPNGHSTLMLGSFSNTGNTLNTTQVTSESMSTLAPHIPNQSAQTQVGAGTEKSATEQVSAPRVVTDMEQQTPAELTQTTELTRGGEVNFGTTTNYTAQTENTSTLTGNLGGLTTTLGQNSHSAEALPENESLTLSFFNNNVGMGL
ncbi:MAG: hypothetical protein IKZ02_01270 [Alphaproteobacteria bacterium]|nr:hypothetical protein [Alphaproteobacteria bacterium]